MKCLPVAQGKWLLRLQCCFERLESQLFQLVAEPVAASRAASRGNGDTPF